MKRLAVTSIALAFILAVFAVALQARQKSAASPVIGTWNCIAHGAPSGDIPFTLYLQKSPEGLTGTVSAPQGDTGLSSVTFKNNQIKITIDTAEYNYSLTATLAHGKLTGKWSRDDQTHGTWEGKR